MRTAAIFPGAGVELSGHERALYERFATLCEPVLAEASRQLGTPLASGLSPEGFASLGPAARQGLTCALGVAFARVAEELHGTPVVAAGHSLGLYGALVHAGTLELSEGLLALEAAHELASAQIRGGGWGLAAVLGVSGSALDALLVADRRYPSVTRVIHNGPISHVLGGRHEELEALLSVLREDHAAKLRWIDREVPYHHPDALVGVSDRLRARLAKLRFRPARFPIVSTLDHRLLTHPDDLVELTARNVAEPIDWAGVVRHLSEARLDLVIECGPGTTLSRMDRLVDPELAHATTKQLLGAAK